MLMERLEVIIAQKRGDITGQKLVMWNKTYGCPIWRHRNKTKGPKGGMGLDFLSPQSLEENNIKQGRKQRQEPEGTRFCKPVILF